MAAKFVIGDEVSIRAKVVEIDYDGTNIVLLPWGEYKAMDGDELELALSAEGKKLAKDLAKEAHS